MSYDRDKLASSSRMLSAFTIDSVARVGESDLGKSLIETGRSDEQRSRDMVYLLFFFDKVRNYSETIEGSFIGVRALASQADTQRTVKELNRKENANLSPITYGMFFNQKTDEELFAMAPLILASAIKTYVSNYFDSLGTPMQNDKKKITEILEHGYGFSKKDSREMLGKIYEYIPKALTVIGFFNLIGEDEKIDEEKFAEDYAALIAQQKFIADKLSKKLRENLKKSGVPMYARESDFDRFKRLLRLKGGPSVSSAL